MAGNLQASQQWTREFYFQTRDKAAGLVMYYLRDADAVQDVLQAVYLDFWKAWKKRGIRDPEAYLMRMARNASLDFQRLRKREVALAAWYQPVDANERDIDTEALTTALAALEKGQQEVVDMHTGRCCTLRSENSRTVSSRVGHGCAL